MKTIVKVLFAVALLIELTAFATVSAPRADAVTTLQMRLEIANAMIDQHPDLPPCDAGCTQAWIDSGNQWLVPFAERVGLPLETVVRAHQSWSYDWGVQFERLYKRPPTAYDWANAYADNMEAFRARFDVAPQMFAVNRWSDEHYFRLKHEYGGPY
jgi:hypothetical protein